MLNKEQLKLVANIAEKTQVILCDGTVTAVTVDSLDEIALDTLTPDKLTEALEAINKLVELEMLC